MIIVLSEDAKQILLKMEPPFTSEQAEQYIEYSAKFRDAIIFSCIFWPQFHLYDHYVFLSEFENSLELALRECNQREQIEAYVNHRHIIDLFGNPFAKASANEINYLGNILHDMWSAKLLRDFPEKRFEVEFCNKGQENPVGSYITFWQI